MKIRINQSIGWLALIALIAAGLIVFIFLPINRQLETRTDSVIDKRSQLADLQDQVQNSGRSQGVSDLDQKQAELNRLLIPKSDLLDLLSTIEEQARVAGVTETLSLDEFPASAPAIVKHPIRLTVSGDYGRIMAFLRSLEGLDYYMNFDEFTLTSGAAPQTAGLNPASLPDNAPAAAASEPVQLTLGGFAYWR